MRNDVERNRRRRLRPRSLMSTLLTIVSLLCTLLRPANVPRQDQAPPEVCILCNPPCIKPSECDTKTGTCSAKVNTESPPPPSVPKPPPPEQKVRVDMQQDTSIGTPTTSDELLQLEMMRR